MEVYRSLHTHAPGDSEYVAKKGVTRLWDSSERLEKMNGLKNKSILSGGGSKKCLWRLKAVGENLRSHCTVKKPVAVAFW